MSSDSASVDRLFAALASPLRRQLVATLHENTEKNDGNTLAVETAVAALDERLQGAPAKTGSTEMGSAETKRSETRRPETKDQLRTALHHNHLPKLASIGVLAYDDEAERIGKGPQFRAARRLLRTATDS